MIKEKPTFVKYKRPSLYFHPHIETIAPALTRKIKDFSYTERKRITTLDNDFLDLDLVKNGSDAVVILSHGLEGSSARPYIRGMARAVSKAGFDVIAWNYRGCSEEMNRQLRFYHSGATEDLQLIVDFALENDYRSIHLIGFSLGGNITLKYVGEQGSNVNPQIESAVAFSVPLDLHTSCLQISKPGNFLYAKRFLKNLKAKITEKAHLMPGKIDTAPLPKLRTLIDFDDCYTAPIHGFKDAVTYYHECSSLRFVDNVRVPTLIVNALNDPFLSKECYPLTRWKDHAYITFEAPKQGGHVGFTEFRNDGIFWSEKRAISFIKTS
ncbi:MAG: alpha/beta fold hydrolase [Bacteroidota bacterium]